MKIETDIRYADGHFMDVYTPDQPTGGAVLVLHTGWLQSDKSEAVDVARLLCDEGFYAFVPTYRMPPHTLFSAARSDALASLNWMLASDFDFDRNQVAVWGFSAGGTLAVEVALAAKIAGVTFSAMIDLKGFMEETASIADRDFDFDFTELSRDAVERGGRNDQLLRSLVLQLVANNTSWLASSTPLCRVSSSAGPLLMFNGVSELVPADGAIALQRALVAAGVPSTVTVMPGCLHGRQNLYSAFPEALRFTVANIAMFRAARAGTQAA